MGWGMAKNLRAKIPTSAQLLICELVETRRDSFIAETEGLIEAVQTPREVAEQAVSI
jgi:3-hydroxyisobutyrate/3-hydroxypropionate dehydrogenase